MTSPDHPDNSRTYEAAAPVLMGIGLILSLQLHLLPALLAGLLVYALVHVLAARLVRLTDRPGRAKLAVVALLATLVVTAVVTFSVLGTAFFRGEHGSLAVLLQKMAEIIEGSRDKLPDWAQEWLPPADGNQLKAGIVAWLREHANEVKVMGGEAGRVLVHALVGMVIGALVALREAQAAARSGPLSAALVRSASRLGQAFHRIVFAQVRISALNATLTAIYLLVALPLFGVHLALAKTMIAITFLVGLLPVLGNLVSNTVIVVISLSHSLPVAVASFAFLVVVHKLEYFVNARIVGSQIDAQAWELLLAMLVMEAAFGVAGVISAPVFYAYAKSELKARRMI